MKPSLRLVTATRRDPYGFWTESLLGRSLTLVPEPLRPELVVAFENGAGLPQVYNRAIDATPGETPLLFVHDDVFIHDVFFAARIDEALARWDVVGLAGSRASDLRQPSWSLAFDASLTAVAEQWNLPNAQIELSGVVGHALRPDTAAVPASRLSLYGPTPRACDLLDGLFLAARASRLRDHGVRFDTQFDFHLYDLDFCRAAARAGLTLGTWPIFVTHASGGRYASDGFRKNARAYLDKWEAQFGVHGRCGCPEGHDGDEGTAGEPHPSTLPPRAHDQLVEARLAP